MTLSVRRYIEADAPALALIYYNTIHEINQCDYSKTQLNAWAPESSRESKQWLDKWERLEPFVAIINGEVVGFTEFESSGYIDCFYVHHEHQGCGVGSELMTAVFNQAKHDHINKLWADVSLTAKPFFESKGFRVTKEQVVTLRGVDLDNVVMEYHC